MVGKKKAEGLALQVIVIAAIALVVLIIVLSVFKGGIDKIRPSLNKVNDCSAKNGHCEKSGGCASTETEIYGLGCDLEKNPDGSLKKNPDGSLANPACCIKPK